MLPNLRFTCRANDLGYYSVEGSRLPHKCVGGYELLKSKLWCLFWQMKRERNGVHVYLHV